MAGASASRASCDDETTRARRDAGNACAICIDICQDCRKCLCRSCFLDSRLLRSSRDESACESRNVVNGGVRGLRVANFARKIFSCSPACSLGGARETSPLLRIIARRFATRTSLCARHARSLCAEKEMPRWRRGGEARHVRAIVRDRAWISGDR